MLQCYYLFLEHSGFRTFNSRTFKITKKEKKMIFLIFETFRNKVFIIIIKTFLEDIFVSWELLGPLNIVFGGPLSKKRLRSTALKTFNYWEVSTKIN